MAKIATDLKQSKQLAKTLPLESADMVLLHEEPYETSDSKFDGLHQALCVPFNKYNKSWRQKYKNISYFPCWSLAALLGVLDYEIVNEEGVSYFFNIYKEDNQYQLCYRYELDDTGEYDIWTDSYDDFVDACVEMIKQLNERELL